MCHVPPPHTHTTTHIPHMHLPKTLIFIVLQIRDFLGEIEQYVNKLSDIQSYVEFLKWEHKRRSSLTPHFIKHLPPRLVLQRRIKIIPPSTDESDDERTVHVSGDVPLSRKEVRVMCSSCIIMSVTL